MTLSARGKRLLSLLEHGPVCSQELLQPQFHKDFGNYPPRAACELETWLCRHTEAGRLVRDRDCITHKSCVRYRFVHSSTWPLQPLRAVPVNASER
jgi:hypothetical protein